MRSTRKYGRGGEAPAFEAFMYRAEDLAKELRLCERCLRGRRRCGDSRRGRANRDRGWKAHRDRQWAPRRGP